GWRDSLKLQAPWLTRVRASAGALAVACAGSCNTVACWPTHKWVSNTIWPSGNSMASWGVQGLSKLIFRNRPTRWGMFRGSFLRKLRRNPVSLRRTSLSNAISVPGRRHTATFGSPTAENPYVVVFQNCVETNLSPTLADRDGTSCRL